MLNELKNKAKSKKGSVSIEYVIIIIAIVVVVAGAMMLLGGRVKSSITSTTDTLGDATTCAQLGGVWDATDQRAVTGASGTQEGALVPNGGAHCYY